MAHPTKRPILNGPGQRDLEQAFLARNLGALARFTISNNDEPVEMHLKILNFSFVTCQGPNYSLGGILMRIERDGKAQLPPFNFLFVEYNAETRTGTMEFSNGE
jgi:hypothetical protein